MMKLASNIHTLRVINGYTQKKIAADLHITQSYYSKIERDQASVPTDLLMKIAEYFNVPVQKLLYSDLRHNINTEKEK